MNHKDAKVAFCCHDRFVHEIYQVKNRLQELRQHLEPLGMVDDMFWEDMQSLIEDLDGAVTDRFELFMDADEEQDRTQRVKDSCERVMHLHDATLRKL